MHSTYHLLKRKLDTENHKVILLAFLNLVIKLSISNFIMYSTKNNYWILISYVQGMRFRHFADLIYIADALFCNNVTQINLFFINSMFPCTINILYGVLTFKKNFNISICCFANLIFDLSFFCYLYRKTYIFTKYNGFIFYLEHNGRYKTYEKFLNIEKSSALSKILLVNCLIRFLTFAGRLDTFNIIMFFVDLYLFLCFYLLTRYKDVIFCLMVTPVCLVCVIFSCWMGIKGFSMADIVCATYASVNFSNFFKYLVIFIVNQYISKYLV